MLFTREPIIETVITARNGFRLCVRSSKAPGEELTVDAVEIVSFSQALFFRNVERPKAFLLPVSDYEVSEVRETRLSLRHPTQDLSKKAETPHQRTQQPKPELRPEVRQEEEPKEHVALEESEEAVAKNDPRRDRRRQRRRRGDSRTENTLPVESEESKTLVGNEHQENKTVAPHRSRQRVRGPNQIITGLLPPPTVLLADLFRYEELEKVAETPIDSLRHDFVKTLPIEEASLPPVL